MFKLDDTSRSSFDPETDKGYALDRDGSLWYFGDNVIEFSNGQPNLYISERTKAEGYYGPFTRFQGTATIGNDL